MLNELFEITTNTRIHWIYLLSAAVISVFYIKQLKPLSLHYIWNSSSKLDLQLFLTNRVLKFFFILPLEVFVVYQICHYFLTLNSLPNLELDLSSEPAFIIYTIVLFVFDDFLRFIQHYFMHKVPFLWEIHKVHHSAHSLNPMSLYRVHFLEVGISALRRIFGTSLLTCAMFMLSTQTISPYQILGALSFNFIFNLLGGNLRHSHVPFSFGLLERVFISPLQHQIHHSKNPKHFDKNFGVALSIWDQLFSSWHKGQVSEPIKVGLTYSERNHKNSLASALFSPLKKAFKVNNTIFKAKENTTFKKSSLKVQGDLI